MDWLKHLSLGDDDERDDDTGNEYVWNGQIFVGLHTAIRMLKCTKKSDDAAAGSLFVYN